MLRFRTPTGSIEALPQQEARVRGLSDMALLRELGAGFTVASGTVSSVVPSCRTKSSTTKQRASRRQGAFCVGSGRCERWFCAHGYAGDLDGQDPRTSAARVRRLPHDLPREISKAADCLAKDREALLAFYDFPVEHWVLHNICDSSQLGHKLETTI